ncbi:hypothetical protein COB57_03060 [Candidatus Peregrinibacteria bacterium]|nr:MAG: hypothetical protein COB57_03060 [Candidatus Peregrinibacteria bacterium]
MKILKYLSVFLCLFVFFGMSVYADETERGNQGERVNNDFMGGVDDVYSYVCFFPRARIAPIVEDSIGVYEDRMFYEDEDEDFMEEHRYQDMNNIEIISYVFHRKDIEDIIALELSFVTSNIDRSEHERHKYIVQDLNLIEVPSSFEGERIYYLMHLKEIQDLMKDKDSCLFTSIVFDDESSRQSALNHEEIHRKKEIVIVLPEEIKKIKEVLLSSNLMDGIDAEYLEISASQFIQGNYTEDFTALGTAMQVGAGIVGFDVPMDIRDIYHDFTHWEWSWAHAGKTTLDTVSVAPVIGGLKYSGKVLDVTKVGLSNAKNIIFGVPLQKAVVNGAENINLKVVESVVPTKVVKTALKLPKFKWTQDLDDHIFKGHLRTTGKGWKATGVHHVSAMDGGKVRLAGEKIDLGNGFYKSKIQMYGDDLYKIEKNNPQKLLENKGWKNKQEMSTFFPDSWSKKKIIEGIGDAYKNITFDGKRYFGNTNGGLRIEFRLNQSKEIESAFPNF